MIIESLFLYTGLTGSTINPILQKILNTWYTILSLSACIIPFLFKNFYPTDNNYILLFNIVVVYIVYISCVNYFKLKDDNLSYSNFEKECTENQKKSLRLITMSFIIIALYCQICIPISLKVSNDTTTIQILASILIGHYWLFFYMICCSIFLYINVYCMGQTTVIRNWMKGLKRRTQPTDIDSIYQMYNHFYKTTKRFNQNWINVVLITFCMLSFRIPISFVLVVYKKFTFEIILLIFYIYAWFQLLIPICELNKLNDFFKTYFYKHDIIDNKFIEPLLKYNEIRTLGISFYGFMPSYKHIMSVVIIVSNVIIPTFISFILD